MKKIFAICTLFLLSACVSSSMNTYMNAPISAVMMDYGQPDFVMDTGPNQKTFVWKRIATSTSPAVIESGNVHDIFENRPVSRTTIQMPEQETATCYYAFYTQNMNGSGNYPSDWIVVGYRKPDFVCEHYF